jgi:hypothetical protein
MIIKQTILFFVVVIFVSAAMDVLIKGVGLMGVTEL